jgi:ABC-type multidrug transport system, ATPase component
MIKIENITKNFGNIRALDDVTAQINRGSIFGLIGSNGSGKSTLMKIMCGIIRADNGNVFFDGEGVYDNIAVKNGIVYLSDEQYFAPHCTIEDMKDIYKSLYTTFSQEKYDKLCGIFGLDKLRKINTFSKGMQKQASILLALSLKPRYLLCDETFDGLDPVMRQLVKRLIAEDVSEGTLTPIIASHNLRELEDICDHIGLLHKGGILFEREIDDLKLNLHKVQAVFAESTSSDDIESALDIVSFDRRGSLCTLIVRGAEDEIMAQINRRNPVFCERIPLTLEEIFICEMEDRGYDYSKIIL